MELFTFYLFILGMFLLLSNVFFIFIDKYYRNVRIIGSMRLENLLRILIEMPFMVIYLTSFLFFLFRYSNSELINWVLMILYGVFLVGYGIHWTADSIDIIQHGFKLEGNEIEKKAQELSYFLDEIVSHKLVFYPMFSLFIILLVGINPTAYLTTLEIFLNVISGITLGLFFMVGAIEGQSPYEAIIFAVILLIKDFKELLVNGINILCIKPIVLLTLVMGIIMIIIAIIWYVKFGGFKEPHEVYV